MSFVLQQKFFNATNQLAMDPGSLKLNNVNISSEFNGTGLVL